MRKIDREEAHRLLDVMIDAIERLRGINDHDALEAAGEDAMAAYQKFRAATFADMLKARNFSSGFTGREFQLEARAPEALRMAGEPCTPLESMDREETHLRRRQLRRMVLDHADELSPGVPEMVTLALLDLNLGHKNRFFEPYKVQGLKNGARDDEVEDACEAILVGYSIGYNMDEFSGLKNEEIARKYSDILEGKSWAGFNARMNRAGLKQLFTAMKKQGVEDRAAKKPFDPGMRITTDKLAKIRSKQSKN